MEFSSISFKHLSNACTSIEMYASGDTFKQIFKDNLLYDGVYIEPYAGGASVALSLLFNEYASKIIINDIDRSIFAFWHSVLNKPEEFSRLINDTPVNMETWYRQKEIQKNNAIDFRIALKLNMDINDSEIN